jgi:uncharacterized protein
MPNSSDRLSILGFGCMRLAQKDGAIDYPRATRQLRSAINAGVNYVDTAWPYHGGDSENFVGHALGDGYRERVKLATKLPTWMVQSRQDMDRYLGMQLAKLKTTHIDYYLVHSLTGGSWERVKKLGIGEFLDGARAAGKIGKVGFSFHSTLAEFKQVVDARAWDFCQLQYNFIDTEHQAGTEGLKHAAAKGMGIVVMQPLRGGALAKTPPPAVEAIWNESPARRTPAEWALRWVWNHPEVTVVLSGMNEENQLEENLAIAETALPGSLTEADLDLIRRAGRTFRSLMKVGCTGCAYCEPCPMDVGIASAFDAYNHLHMFGNAGAATFMYVVRLAGILSGKRGYASQCEQCGDCVDKCPQGLAIPELLAEVTAQFESGNLASVEETVRQALAR